MMQRHFRMVDFSPTEVADLGLVDLQRSAVYNAIKRGDLHATKDERGHFRITQAEIDRYTSKRHEEHPNFGSRPSNRLLLQSFQRESGRMGGLIKAATHSPQEIAEPLQRGRRRWLERQVDPEHILPPDELERRVQAAHLAHMAKARMARIEKEMLKRQYGDQQA